MMFRDLFTTGYRGVCAQCRLTLPTGESLCGHHERAMPDTWARGNKAACDFFHRGKTGHYKPLSKAERVLYLEEYSGL